MRLNFGCGPDVRDGWTNLDRDDHGQEFVVDLLDGLPFADDTFGVIVANHSINGIRFDDLDRAIAELRRVLTPGGTLRVLVPDAEWAYANVDLLPISTQLEPTIDGRVLRYLFWHGDSRCAFTDTSLMNTLRRNGFKRPHRAAYGGELDSREAESLIVEATK